MTDSYTGIDRARSKLLGLAVFSSFVSATWGGEETFSNKAWALWGFIELGYYTFPIVSLVYATFFLIFVTKVILEWQLGIPLPSYMQYVCVGLAWCTQLLAIILGNIVNSKGTILSDWEFVNLMSIMSFTAITIYFGLSILPGVWRALSNRLAIPEPSHEPLLPAHSVHPVESYTAQARAKARSTSKPGSI